MDHLSLEKFTGGIQIPTGASSTYVLTSDGSGNATWAAATGGGGVPTDVPLVIPVSAVSSYTFSGLDGDSDKVYELIWIGATSASAYPSLRFNADTGANYGQQDVLAYNGTTVVAGANAAQTSIILGNYAGGSGQHSGRALIYAQTGQARLVSALLSSVTASKGVDIATGTWSNTASNLISMTFMPSSGTFTGTLILRKLTAPATVIGGSRVTSLPGSPVNGQEVYLQPDPSGQPAVLWHLRYDSTATKWDFLGGSDWRTYGSGSQLCTGSYADFTGISSFTTPVAGIWEIFISGMPDPRSNGADVYVGAYTGTAPTDTESINGYLGMAGEAAFHASRWLPPKTLSSSTVVKIQIKGSGTAYVYRPELRIRPLRIG